MIRVRTLGECSIDVDGTTIRPGATMVFAVLLYLGVERGRRIEREQLAGMFWPRASTARRRHNLRQILYKLSQFGVHAGGSTGPLELPANEVWLDFEDEPVDDGGVLARAGSGRTGVLGYSPRAPAPFHEWLDDLRTRVEASLRKRASAALMVARRAAAWEEVERLALFVLQFDSLNEEATLSLAEATALRGSKARAQEILARYTEELGPRATDARIPADVLRRRIAERLPSRTGPLAHIPMVGREAVMTELTGLVERARAGAPTCHLITGPHGIGKTRVLEELAQQLSLTSARPVIERGLPDDAEIPGLTLTRIFRALLRQPGALGIAPDVLAFVQRITAQYSVSADRHPFDWSEDALVRALVDLERAIAWETLLVLGLDDAHLADKLSFRILKRAHGCLTGERILLVLTAKDDTSSTLSTASHRVLERLNDEASAHLATLWLEAQRIPVDDDAAEAVAVASGGNPFMLREAVIAFNGSQQRRPVPLDEILRQRCAELSVAARDVLLTTLILGEHASVAMLLSAFGQPDDKAEEAIIELEKSRIIACEPTGAVQVHNLWMHALGELFSAAQIAARRIRIGRLLEASSHGRSDAAELLVSSAAQYQRAGDTERASTTFARSGAAFEARALGSAAAAAYSRAAMLAPSAPRVDQRLAQAIIAASEIGHYDDVKNLLSSFGERLLRSRGLGVDQLRLQLIAARLRQLAGDTRPELAHACAQLIGSEMLTPEERLRAGLTGMRIAEFVGDTHLIEQLYDLCVGIRARSAPAQVLLAEIRVVHALGSRRVGDACQIAEECLASIGEGAQPFDYLNTRVPHWFNCAFARIGQLIASAQRCLQGYPATLAMVRVADVAAAHFVDVMDLGAAREQYQLALDLVDRFDHHTQLPIIAQTASRLRIAEGVDDVVESDPIAAGRSPLSRDELFSLCNRTIRACRRGERDTIDSVADALATECKHLERVCPMDYPFAALAIAQRCLTTKGLAQRTWDRHLRSVRVADNPPAPFIGALLREFSILA